MTDHHSHTDEGSSFITGFTIGLFAGAAGYYLFASEDGAKLRKQLVAEWESAKEKLAEEGVIDNPQVSLREFIQELLHNAFQHAAEDTTDSKTMRLIAADDLEAGRKKAREVTNRVKKEASKRFKGV